MSFPIDVQMSVINQIAGQLYEGNQRSAMRYVLELPCRQLQGRAQSPKRVYKAMKSLDKRARGYNGDYTLAIKDFLIANPLNLREI